MWCHRLLLKQMETETLDKKFIDGFKTQLKVVDYTRTKNSTIPDLNDNVSADGFTFVKSRKTKRKPRRNNVFANKTVDGKPVSNLQLEKLKSDETIDKELVLNRLHTTEVEIQTTQFYKQVCSFLEKLMKSPGTAIQKIVCLALGNFSKFVSSRHQLSFLSLLGRKFLLPIEIYDPVFTDTERLILSQDLNMKLISNKKGSITVKEVTLFFLPHSSHQLTNNVLHANWDQDLLYKCILICNKLSTIRDDLLSCRNSEKLDYILNSKEVVEVIDFSDLELSEAFTETVIHYFPKEKIDMMGNSFWTKNEPVYLDPDIL